MPTPSEPALAVHHETILVVESDRGAREGLTLLLRLAGYRVLAVADAASAAERAAHEALDLVIADIDGLDHTASNLLAYLRHGARCPEAPIIVMAAQAPSMRRVAWLDGGADDFMAKPFEAEELLARIRRHLVHVARERSLLRRCTYDDLTGVLSRAAIEEELARELLRARRTGLGVSVLLADLDGFKAINDRYGHAVGDEALRKTARTLLRLVRATDRVGRIGGDEFLVVLPDSDAGDADALLERLSLEWCRRPPMVRGVPEPVLLSIGRATWRKGETLSSLLRRADRAMYRTKERRKSGAMPAPRSYG